MNRLVNKSAWILCSMVVCAVASVRAQGLQVASRLSPPKKIIEASLDRQSPGRPEDPDALLKSAFQLCWHKQFDSAATVFLHVLDLRPNDPDALGGLGFDYAWSGKYDEAASTFTKLARVRPESEEAEKGLAYTALYSGDFEDGISRFTALTIKHPETLEYWIALGEADMGDKRTASARSAFKQAQSLDPSNREVGSLIVATRKAGAFVELDAWGGYSSVEGDSRWGMRFTQLTVQATQQLRLYAKYDNSLSLDNRFFIQSDRFADAWFGGGVYDWNKHLSTKLEYGYRHLGANVSQQLFSFDQVFFPKRQSGYGLTSWHVGGLAGIGSGVPNEYLGYAGAYFTLSRRWGVEPTYYYSVNSFENLQQHRFQGGVKYMAPKGFEMNAGAYWSTNVISSKYPPNDDKVYGAYVFALYPISNRFTGQLSWRQEAGTGATQSVSTISAGLRIRFEK
ncbi:MAG: tetratricopeptide repeat protein [Bacteroidota bacterium]|nr:tetratricopeptide repeat protein [Bacteroidota bacterium]MDP4217811.1 tetratricopeptide repeat protein [Bacteroidota bacterium]MDP4248183.1 tetratricopeptide repeat protein [Bacteroidota bacterium]MDP4254057.1 tetratricopeptide repeat protein [Bacteroidota bacterium]MDP4258167.1 tetratricopeptide repeat protein [Bacteroidota bacterium]